MTPWQLAVMLAFTIGSLNVLIYPVLAPGILGSHAVVYTDAAAAWLAGGDPWAVGPPDVVFSGPPTMLVPFVPFTLLPGEVTRVAWVVGMLAAAGWSIRRLGLPWYWLGFPPLLSNIVLGHVEVLLLLLLVAGGRLSGLAAVIKPYAGLPLLAERRWAAIGVAAVVGVATLLFLPWGRFLDQLPEISATLVRQSKGDSAFGDPALMVVGAVALLSLGWRQALWLATPVLWPSTQPGYKTICIPALPPILAAAWALPFNGVTLAGLVVYAVLVQVGRRRILPAWLREGIEPSAAAFREASSAMTGRSGLAHGPAGAAAMDPA